MRPTTQKYTELLQALTSHKLLVDTCFLMDQNFPNFLHEFKLVFQQNKILIPRRVVQELQRITKLNDHRLSAVTRALISVEAAIREGMAELRGEVSDDTTKVADHVIVRVVLQHIGQHRILVLTQDRKLMRDIFQIKKSESFSTSNSLLVVRFSLQSGRPHLVRGQDTHDVPDGRASPQPLRNTLQPRQKPMRKPPISNPFKKSTTLAPDLQVRITAQVNVEQSGIVFVSDRRPVRLTSRLASGGEGTVYETDQGGLVCKLYHRDKLTVGTQKKIELMVTRSVPDATICWPKEPVYDGYGVFRGFLMPRATGTPLGHGVFIPIVWLRQQPKWTRRESVRLTITILEKIDLLHRMGVLLGDINPLNVLVQNQNVVYFVDCDSYQVEGYPCPVGSINFVAPEIQGRDFRQFLRTREHELFAVATLLFMIMIPGKSPFSHQGGTDGADNIKKMHFPYPLGEKRSDGAPDGAWRFCWSHLTRALKEAFFQSFHVDHKDKPRVMVGDWLRAFREYEYVLSKPGAVFNGPRPQYGFDLSILPQNFRYVEDKGQSLPTGGETDLQRAVKRIAQAASPSPRPEQQRQSSRGAGVPAQRSSSRQKAQPSTSSPSSGRAALTHKPSSKGACFVATAVFLDEQHPTVDSLRRYRDVVLKKYTLGRWIIWGYERIGPIGACIVDWLPWTRRLLRPMLNLVAYFCQRIVPLSESRDEAYNP